MKLSRCRREQEVVDAIRSGKWATAWGDEIRQHAAACAVCADVAFAARVFQREAELAQDELHQSGARLPSAGFVWWKARLAARRAAEERVAEPVVLVERVAYALGALAALGLVVWRWPNVAGWLRRFATSAVISRDGFTPDYFFGTLHRLAQAWASQSFLLAATAAAFLSLMLFTAYVVWRED